MTLIIYIMIVLLLVFLSFVSRKETPTEKTEGIKSLVKKMSQYIYKLLVKKELLKKSDLARLSMQRLFPGKKANECVEKYYIEKIEYVLYIMAAGCCLAVLSYCSARTHTLKVNNQGAYLERQSYGEGAKRESLDVRENGQTIGSFDIELEERKYTKAEAEKLYIEAATYLEQIILSENKSLDEVSENLNLVTEIPGYPFEISWRSDDNSRIRSDGTLVMDGIYDLPDEGVCVVLEAVFKYSDYSWIQTVPIRIVSPYETELQELQRKIGEKLTYEQQESIYDEIMVLPDKDDSGKHRLTWNYSVKDNSIYIFILSIVAAIAIYISKDRDLSSQVEERRRQMLRKYPQFISQIVLYLGAGMTVRNIFQKLSQNVYENSKQTDYLGAEIKRTVYEMNSGISEQAAYENFADRCGLQQYTRFSTLLCQNLRKGNGELLKLLQEESVKAYEERMDLARKLGEEAGTRLLVPMLMMLLIVMVVIMIPAMISF